MVKRLLKYRFIDEFGTGMVLALSQSWEGIIIETFLFSLFTIMFMLRIDAILLVTRAIVSKRNRACSCDMKIICMYEEVWASEKIFLGHFSEARGWRSHCPIVAR